MDCWIIILDRGRLAVKFPLLIIYLCERVGYPATYMHTHTQVEPITLSNAAGNKDT